MIFFIFIVLFICSSFSNNSITSLLFDYFFTLHMPIKLYLFVMFQTLFNSLASFFGYMKMIRTTFLKGKSIIFKISDFLFYPTEEEFSIDQSPELCDMANKNFCGRWSISRISDSRRAPIYFAESECRSRSRILGQRRLAEF